ncbi:MAG: NADP-dependent oxidoreductase [Myxococcales bacterium]|nr:NADP-dependent oxidoreductase [Myxococcales bacterium]
MKTIGISAYGDLDHLTLLERPEPPLADDGLLVRVRASAINPVDWKIIQGKLAGFLKHELPLTLGWDVAGIVERVGRGVTGFAPGDPVFARPDLDRDGTHAERIAIRAATAAPMPSSLDFVQAAALPLAGLTAWEAIVAKGRVQAGERVLIHAGSGGVGSLAIQLAHHLGATVITTASAASADGLRALGADEVVDYREVDFVERARDIDLVFDTIGGDTQARSWSCLKPGGRLWSIVQTPDVGEAERRGMESGFIFIQPDGETLRTLAGLVEAGALRAVIDTVYTPDQAREAYARSMSGRAKGKLVFRWD